MSSVTSLTCLCKQNGYMFQLCQRIRKLNQTGVNNFTWLSTSAMVYMEHMMLW